MQDLDDPPAPDQNGEAELHLLCGRIAAGKSTLAKSLVKRHRAILIGEDDYLEQLYGDKIQSFADYRGHSQRLRQLITPLCIDLLQRGINIVLDFPANTPSCRQWLKNIIQQSEARHTLHYLTTPVERCREQLQQRIVKQQKNSSPIALNEFDEINRYFVPPDVTEGFNVEIVG